MPAMRSAKSRAPETAIPQSKAAQIVVPTVDELVRDQVFYVNVCEEQSAVFRQNVSEFKEAYDRYAQSTDVARPGQNWQPAACDRDAFVAEMKMRCQAVPNSIADRVKIYCAAHAILACIAFVDMSRHTMSSQLEILGKSNKKLQKDSKRLPATQTPPLADPLMRSIANPTKRLLTAEDYVVFAGNPTTLPDKQFLLQENEAGDSLYEVTEVRFSKGSWEYLVRFEGWRDAVPVSAQEMKEMLQRSSLVESK